jgi:[acyl-carrier-protein] S-malonyltransferase
VLSGHKEAIERAIGLVKEFEIKRGIMLPVSAPFHCDLMVPAADAMADALAAMPPAAFQLPIYANYTAAAVTDPAEERELLVKQVCGRVRWRESMLAMGEGEVEHFVELGGKVVGPMVGRTLEDVQVASVVTMGDIEALAKEL